ncbi:hypothetical protein BT69DRAFT_1276276 [Atractiella rhizophila]|nr:hypothetical protein BT69DRAFT_1276276 [Atractiella rhizophila]
MTATPVGRLDPPSYSIAEDFSSSESPDTDYVIGRTSPMDMTRYSPSIDEGEEDGDESWREEMGRRSRIAARNTSQKSVPWKVTVVLGLFFSLLLSAFFPSNSSSFSTHHDIGLSTILDQVDSTHLILDTVLDISSPSSDAVEVVKASDIYLLSTTLRLSSKHDDKLASKFDDYGDSVRTLQVGIMEIRAGALQAVKDIRRGLESSNWKYTMRKLVSHVPRLERRLEDLIKTSELAAKAGFEALVGLSDSKLMDSQVQQDWKGERIARAVERARLAYDGVRMTRMRLIQAKEVGIRTREALSVLLKLSNGFEGQWVEEMRDAEKERFEDLVTRLSRTERLVITGTNNVHDGD